MWRSFARRFFYHCSLHLGTWNTDPFSCWWCCMCASFNSEFSLFIILGLAWIDVGLFSSRSRCGFQKLANFLFVAVIAVAVIIIVVVVVGRLVRVIQCIVQFLNKTPEKRAVFCVCFRRKSQSVCIERTAYQSVQPSVECKCCKRCFYLCVLLCVFDDKFFHAIVKK